MKRFLFPLMIALSSFFLNSGFSFGKGQAQSVTTARTVSKPIVDEQRKSEFILNTFLTAQETTPDSILGQWLLTASVDIRRDTVIYCPKIKGCAFGSDDQVSRLNIRNARGESELVNFQA